MIGDAKQILDKLGLASVFFSFFCFVCVCVCTHVDPVGSYFSQNGQVSIGHVISKRCLFQFTQYQVEEQSCMEYLPTYFSGKSILKVLVVLSIVVFYLCR